ncbi:MAG: UDP-N-acetylmuramate dehydrogenase [Eubacterium sp.]
MNELIEYLKLLGIDYITDEPMSKHTSFKIGGNAKLVAEPKSVDEIAEIVKKCRDIGIRCIAIGNGSNLLVSDEGIDACVILLGSSFSKIKLIDENTIYAEAGASLMKVCRFALEKGLSGLEFAYGIPGSCGGAAFMNAGAYGGEMKNVLYKCEHIDCNGNAGALEKDALELSYRHSAYYNNGCIITGLYFKLVNGQKDEIKAKMDDLIGRRRNKQPLEYPSAGSTFKRPEGYFAGALIQECGLKGAAVGGAQVSEKHAGFVINTGGATCSDVLELCRMVSDKVYAEKGVKLEMEIRVTK